MEDVAAGGIYAVIAPNMAKQIVALQVRGEGGREGGREGGKEGRVWERVLGWSYPCVVALHWWAFAEEGGRREGGRRGRRWGLICFHSHWASHTHINVHTQAGLETMAATFPGAFEGYHLNVRGWFISLSSLRPIFLFSSSSSPAFISITL
jgi:hypothetical protein